MGPENSVSGDELRDALAALAALDSSEADAMDLDRALAARTALWHAYRRISNDIGEAAVRYIDLHGEQTIGDKRYYVGTEKTYKPRSLPEALTVLFDAAAGDFDGLAACLSSNALKHGAIRGLLDKAGMADRFDAMFIVEERPDVKTGKPKRGLKVARTDGLELETADAA